MIYEYIYIYIFFMPMEAKKIFNKCFAKNLPWETNSTIIFLNSSKLIKITCKIFDINVQKNLMFHILDKQKQKKSKNIL